jgi:hypothetical protein
MLPTSSSSSSSSSHRPLLEKLTLSPPTSPILRAPHAPHHLIAAPAPSYSLDSSASYSSAYYPSGSDNKSAGSGCAGRGMSSLPFIHPSSCFLVGHTWE